MSQSKKAEAASNEPNVLEQLYNAQRLGIARCNTTLGKHLTGAKLDRKDFVAALSGLQQALEAATKIQEMLLRDTLTMVNVVAALEGGILQLSAQVTTIIEFLERKGVGTKVELQELWTKEIQPKFSKEAKESVSAAQTEATQEENTSNE